MSADALARRLAAAWDSGVPLPPPDAAQVPADAAAAYEVQYRTLALRNEPVAGWKVGAKSPDGPIQAAPLPRAQVLASGASVCRSAFGTLGLEVEIAFRFARAFAPRAQPYSTDEVLSAIGQMLAAIEIVSTRHQGWPAIDKLAQLADLQNHGALIVGEPVRYDAGYPWLATDASLELAGRRLNRGTPANPAGDPRRLLPWLVNHACARGLTVGTDMVVTTGSYTGMHFPDEPGRYGGRVAGLPDVELLLLA